MILIRQITKSSEQPDLPVVGSAIHVASGTSNNSTNVRLTRQKPALFQWLAEPLWFPQIEIVCQQIRAFRECFSTRRPASSPAFGGLIHKLTNTLGEANPWRGPASPA